MAGSFSLKSLWDYKHHKIKACPIFQQKQCRRGTKMATRERGLTDGRKVLTASCRVRIRDRSNDETNKSDDISRENATYLRVIPTHRPRQI